MIEDLEQYMKQKQKFESVLSSLEEGNVSFKDSMELYKEGMNICKELTLFLNQQKDIIEKLSLEYENMEEEVKE